MEHIISVESSEYHLYTERSWVLIDISATGQIPDIGPFALIDRDTPQSAYTHTSIEDGSAWELVFSDEFNRDGRTFWAGEWHLKPMTRSVKLTESRR